MNYFSVVVVIPGGPALQFTFQGDGTFYSVDGKVERCGSYSLKIDANGFVWGILSDGSKEFSGHITRNRSSISDIDTYNNGETFGLEII